MAKEHHKTKDLMLNVLPVQVKDQLRAYTRSMGMGLSMAVDMEVEFNSPTYGHSTPRHSMDNDPFTELTEPTGCRLALPKHDFGTMIVGRGMVYPYRSKDLVHNQLLLLYHVKVNLDWVEPKFEDAKVSALTSTFMTLNDARGSCVQWPRYFVILDRQQNVHGDKSKSKSKDKGKMVYTGFQSNESTMKPKALVPDDFLNKLSEDSQEVVCHCPTSSR